MFKAKEFPKRVSHLNSRLAQTNRNTLPHFININQQFQRIVITFHQLKLCVHYSLTESHFLIPGHLVELIQPISFLVVLQSLELTLIVKKYKSLQFAV
jgi:broad-specificity NMP kinase